MYYLFFFIHGLFSIITQVVLVRELIVAFYGNELFSGIVLAIWLLGGGIGSLLALRLKRLKDLKKIFLIQFLLFFIFPLEIVSIRFLIGKIALPGEIPLFSQSIFFVFFLLFPYCFILESLFAWATSLWSQKKKKSEVPYLISQAYFLETIGLALGCLIFNFFLITSTFPFPSVLNKKSLKFRFPNLIESVNSRYGNIAVTKIGKQYNFYESGQFVGSNKEIEVNEYLAHLILTQHPRPKKVLIIGGGLNGLIFEILKYQSIEKVDYLEIDPKLIEITKKYLPTYLIKALEHPKVRINLIDGRKFLKQTNESYDIVIFNLANPSTALINRFYTKECYQQVKKIINKNAVFATSISVPVDYLSKEAISLVSLINQTIKSVFPYQLILPEDSSILFLASTENIISTDQNLVKQRFLKNRIQTKFFSPDYLEYRLKSFKIKQITNILNKQKMKDLNTDFHPLAYFFESTFWQTIFSFKTAKIMRSLGLVDFKIILITLFVLYSLFFVLIKKPSSVNFLTVFSAGFTLMAFEILIIFIFQATLGYVFSKIALIFTLILGALGLGNLWATSKKLSSYQSAKLLRIIFSSIIVYCLLFAFFIKKVPSEISFYILATIIGILIGTVFPLSNTIMLTKEKEVYKKTGFLYSADLLGAFVGAILPSIFLIPIFGVMKTVCLLSLISLFSLVLLLKKLGQ